MSFCTDLKSIYYLTVRPMRGATAAERMKTFYAGQAAIYDDFRDRLLQGRRELLSLLTLPDQGQWVDLGGGTGWCVEQIGPRIQTLRKVRIVDLSESMLAIAQARIHRRRWTNVELIHADAATYRLPDAPVDLVTFFYALTMIPAWQAAIDNAWSMLKPGGCLGVVDFYTSQPHPSGAMLRHSRFTRRFWPAWFKRGGVFISPDHLPHLQQRFCQVQLFERRAKLPYLPFLRVPYYAFLGRKR